MRVSALLLVAAGLLSGPLQAAEADLPKQTSWVAYGSLAYDQGKAIADTLREAAGIDMRVERSADDRSSKALLRDGRVDFSATAVGGSVAAQEGVFHFAAEDWGPQKVRLVLANTAELMNYAIAVAGDLGVETYADLKGRRVAWYANQPVVNVNTEAYLAYSGLDWDDVEKVEIDGFFDEALKALADGEVDAAFAATGIDAAYRAAEGPRGLIWPHIDHDDREAMARMEAVAPYFVPHNARDGAFDAAGHHMGAHYPYPILVAMESSEDDLVYGMAKALVELLPRYAGKAPGIEGWHINEQEFLWFVPYHEGAVRYFKEVGVWTDEAQAHHDTLIARQAALAAAWEALKAEHPDDWERAWAERRHRTLREGGFQPVF